MKWYYILMLIYLFIINIAGIVVTVYDKIASKHGMRRIREKTLMLMSSLGAGIVIFATMQIIRHKTKHIKFMVGIPLIVTIEFILLLIIYFLVKTYV